MAHACDVSPRVQDSHSRHSLHEQSCRDAVCSASSAYVMLGPGNVGKTGKGCHKYTLKNFQTIKKKTNSCLAAALLLLKCSIGQDCTKPADNVQATSAHMVHS